MKIYNKNISDISKNSLEFISVSQACKEFGNHLFHSHDKKTCNKQGEKTPLRSIRGLRSYLGQLLSPELKRYTGRYRKLKFTSIKAQE